MGGKTVATKIRRIAMWSGPRNISTALMRSWENRPDTWVCDEPFYAHYLLNSDADHPGKDVVIANQENDWRKVVDALLGPIPGNHSVFYQKQMTHHFFPQMEGDWLRQLDHVFLLRDPRAMLLSLIKIIQTPVLRDTGLKQQCELFRLVHAITGKPPLVINSADILKDPATSMQKLCMALQLPFFAEMLNWPAGPRDTDGIWSKWWYDAVIASTGFKSYVEISTELPDDLQVLYQECLPYYQEMAESCLVVNESTSR